jgi:hypothetical protein
MLPADVTALKVTVPGPQLAPPVVAVITGVALITKLVAAAATTVRTFCIKK